MQTMQRHRNGSKIIRTPSLRMVSLQTLQRHRLHNNKTMTVYVDNTNHKFRNMRMCHMVADTLEELHEMAEQLKLPKTAFQGLHRIKHYDICKSMRQKALQLGAKPITTKQLVRLYKG